MSQGQIRVSPEQLLGVSGQLAAHAAQIEGSLGALGRAVAPLGSDWAGAAQGRFEALWLEWQRSAAALHDALTGISQLTRNAAVAFERNDAQIAGTFAA